MLYIFVNDSLKKQLVLAALICFHCCGCNKILDVDNPDNKIVGDDLFKDKESAESAVVGIYSTISGTSNVFNGVITSYSAIYSDEAMYTAQVVSAEEFYDGAISTTNTVIERNFWAYAYQLIYHINTCVEKLNKSTSLSIPTKNQLTGECRFLRAFIYFQLVQLFGEVPLVTVADYRANENMARTKISIIKKSILDDLLSAKELLSDNYSTTTTIRVNKWTATAMLARYYLHQEQWPEAEKEATEIINADLYRLTTPDEVFLANSTEAIFQIQPVLDGYNTMEGNAFIPTEAARPAFPLTASLAGAFEVNDKRWNAWVKSKASNGVTYYYPYKYKKKIDFSDNFKLTEYPMIIRYSEILLIRAESRANMGLLPGAISDLDAIRLRAGLPPVSVILPDISPAALSEKIQHERRIEFFMECGHRWFDLKRTGKVHETLSPIKPDWNVTKELWPIPQSQRALNPFLTQNDGY